MKHPIQPRAPYPPYKPETKVKIFIHEISDPIITQDNRCLSEIDEDEEEVTELISECIDGNDGFFDTKEDIFSIADLLGKLPSGIPLDKVYLNSGGLVYDGRSDFNIANLHMSYENFLVTGVEKTPETIKYDQEYEIYLEKLKYHQEVELPAYQEEMDKYNVFLLEEKIKKIKNK